MVLSLQRIFAAAASNVCAGEEVEVCCSYMEVYNEVRAWLATSCGWCRQRGSTWPAAGWLQCCNPCEGCKG